MGDLKRKSSVIMQYMVVLLMMVIIIVPLIILFLASFKDNIEFMNSTIFSLPQSLKLDNYYSVLIKGNFITAFINTFIILGGSVILNILFGTMLAYILGRFTFPGRNLILIMIMGARVIPTVTTQVATFTIIKGLGLFDSLLAPIILYASTDVVQIFLYLQFIHSIPDSLDECATIDGASYFRIYRSIIFPLLKPATVTAIILKMVTVYNDMYIPFLYLPSAEHSVVSTAIMHFCSTNAGSQVPMLAAAFIVVMIPMFVIYIAAQSSIYDGITSGAVKG